MNEKEYRIVWLEVKSPEWKILTLADENQQYGNVSVNKVNKKGEAFPGFDEITNAGTVKGNLWQSPQGKYYLFAPKPASNRSFGAQGGGFKANIEKVMDKKDASIEKFQGSKELGIKTSSTARMACEMVVATLAGEKIIDESVIKGKIEMWRKYFWMHWDDPETYPPFE